MAELDWDWAAMSSSSNLERPDDDPSLTPHILWDTPGVSIQGWSGHTAYALDVQLPPTMVFATPDIVLSRLDGVLSSHNTAKLETIFSKTDINKPDHSRSYVLHLEGSDPIFLLASADTQECENNTVRLRVVLWNKIDKPSPTKKRSSHSRGMYSLIQLVLTYVKLTADQIDPKNLMTAIASSFGTTASSIDGASSASIVLASKGQALSVLIQSRFVWWFATSSLIFGALFLTLIFGLPSISDAADLLDPLNALAATSLGLCVWALVAIRRNWRRSKL